MAKGFASANVVDTEKLKENVEPAQILEYFGYTLDENNKCLCPVHDDKDPSLQVNADYVYCYGCGWNADIFKLVEFLLKKKENKSYTFPQIVNWIVGKKFTTSSREYTESEYRGPVPQNLVEYWHSLFSEFPDLYESLYKERLLLPDTVNKNKIGYHPLWDAWVLPYWRGLPGKSEIDIVQFRFREKGRVPKYIGLTGHNRPSILNSYLLEKRKWVVVLFGTFDGYLAQQDFLPAVGINSVSAFLSKEKDRFIHSFDNVETVFLVPDRTESEKEPVSQLASYLGKKAHFRPFPDFDGKDYQDWRQSGKTPAEFVTEVLKISFPKNDGPLNLMSLVCCGDQYNLIPFHLEATRPMYQSCTNLVQDLLSIPQQPPFHFERWESYMKDLERCSQYSSLEIILKAHAGVARDLQGAW